LIEERARERKTERMKEGGGMMKWEEEMKGKGRRRKRRENVGK
jgi:hypothetical protein